MMRAREQCDRDGLDRSRTRAVTHADDQGASTEPRERTVEELSDLRGSSSEAPIRLAAASGILLPADRGLQRLVRYEGGVDSPRDVRADSEGRVFDVLKDARSHYLVKAIQVRSAPECIMGLDWGEAAPVIENYCAEKNEVIAKLLVALFAVANDAAAVDPSRILVDPHDLLELVLGYRRRGPSKTNSRQYDRAFADLIRYLTVDLPNVQVNILVTRRRDREELAILGEFLMHRPRFVTKDKPLDRSELLRHLHAMMQGVGDGDVRVGNDAREQDVEAAIRFIKNANIDGLVLAFPKAVLEALGHRVAMQITNPGILKLRGPAWWMAYDLVHLIRWSASKGLRTGLGLPVLKVLYDNGFLRASERRASGRVSHKVALRMFFDTVDKLLDLGELDEPGVRLWRPHGGPDRLKDVTRSVRESLSTRGRRITAADLDPVRVEFVLPAERRARLAKVRQRAAARKPRLVKKCGQVL
jgi:hypothetical protein